VKKKGATKNQSRAGSSSRLRSPGRESHSLVGAGSDRMQQIEDPPRARHGKLVQKDRWRNDAKERHGPPPCTVPRKRVWVGEAYRLHLKEVARPPGARRLKPN